MEMITRKFASWVVVLTLAAAQVNLGQSFAPRPPRLFLSTPSSQRQQQGQTTATTITKSCMYREFSDPSPVASGNFTSMNSITTRSPSASSSTGDDDDGDDSNILRYGLMKRCLSSSKSLQEIYGLSNPMDRVLIMAEGSVQLLFASFYDAQVQVDVTYCRQVPCNGEDHAVEPKPLSCWDRQVNLLVKDQYFCTAHSRIRVHDEHCQRLVESGKVGLGQLWQHFHLSPTFDLIEAGISEEGGVWRRYSMNCEALSCEIEEQFVPDVWNLKL
jgi:chorismate-pyruvate lyase